MLPLDVLVITVEQIQRQICRHAIRWSATKKTVKAHTQNLMLRIVQSRLLTFPWFAKSAKKNIVDKYFWGDHRSRLV